MSIYPLSSGRELLLLQSKAVTANVVTQLFALNVDKGHWDSQPLTKMPHHHHLICHQHKHHHIHSRDESLQGHEPECDKYIQIFEYSNISDLNIYSDIRSYHFLDTNIFGYSFVSTFWIRINSDIRS